MIIENLNPQLSQIIGMKLPHRLAKLDNRKKIRSKTRCTKNSKNLHDTTSINTHVPNKSLLMTGQPMDKARIALTDT